MIRRFLMWLFHCSHLKYKVNNRTRVGKWILLDVTFAGCPNGRKYLLYYKDVPLVLEPHFGYTNSPVARFTPTLAGWRIALDFMQGHPR